MRCYRRNESCSQWRRQRFRCKAATKGSYCILSVRAKASFAMCSREISDFTQLCETVTLVIRPESKEATIWGINLEFSTDILCNDATIRDYSGAFFMSCMNKKPWFGFWSLFCFFCFFLHLQVMWETQSAVTDQNHIYSAKVAKFGFQLLHLQLEIIWAYLWQLWWQHQSKK